MNAMTNMNTTSMHRTVEYRADLRGHRRRNRPRLGMPAEYVAVMVAVSAHRTAADELAARIVYYRSLRMNPEVVLASASRGQVRKYARWRPETTRPPETSIASKASYADTLSMAEHAVQEARDVEMAALRDLTMHTRHWRKTSRLCGGIAVQPCSSRRDRRQRSTRRSRVLARSAAKLASASNDSGDPEAEPPHRWRRLARVCQPHVSSNTLGSSGLGASSRRGGK